MVYNKGTVSFDQWTDEFFDLAYKEEKKIGIVKNEVLEKYYNEGMDIEEALMQFENDKA